MRRARALANVLIAAAIPLVACSQDRAAEGDGRLSEVEPESVSSEAAPETRTDYVPECERLEYPCTYAEVEPELLDASLRLGTEAGTMLEEATTDEVAAWLREHDDVVDVQHDETAIRFRTEGGRPLWLTKNQPGSRSGPAHPLGPAPTPVAAPAPPVAAATTATLDTNTKNAKRQNGVQPTKRALVLSPFHWEFGGDETDRIHQYLVTNLQSRARRDYRNNVFEQTKTSPTGNAPGLGNFFMLDWHQFDLIHLSTHGEQLCPPLAPGAAGPASCYTAIYTGALFVPSGGSYPSVGVPGVEWSFGGTPGCRQLTPSDPSYQTSGCATGRWWEAATVDFFALAVGPLENTVIYMSACESMKSLDLARVLLGSGSVFFGFTKSVDSGVATYIGERFHEQYLFRGRTAEQAFADIASQTLQIVPSGISKSPLPAPNQTTEMVRSGSQTLRGREVVALLDQTTGAEFVDDGVVSNVVGTPNDGRPDSIRVIAEVDGIFPPHQPQNFPVEIQVDGAPAIQTSLQTNTVPGVWTVEATVPLGFDHNPQDVFDIEVRADLEEGGRSRWRYERLRLAGCYWTLDVSGVTGSGRYTGVQATFLDMPGGMTITLGGVDDERVITTVLMQNPPGPGSGPVPFPLGGSNGGQEGALTLHLGQAGGTPSIPFASGDGSPVYHGSPRQIIDYQPPPTSFTYSRLDQEWAEGHAFGVIFSPRMPGPGIDKASIQLHFRAKEALDLNSFLGSGGFPTTMPDPDPCNKHT